MCVSSILTYLLVYVKVACYFSISYVYVFELFVYYIEGAGW